MVKLSRDLLAGDGAGPSSIGALGGIGGGSTVGLEPIGTSWEFAAGGTEPDAVPPAVAGVEEAPDALACFSDTRSAAPATLA